MEIVPHLSRWQASIDAPISRRKDIRIFAYLGIAVCSAFPFFANANAVPSVAYRSTIAPVAVKFGVPWRIVIPRIGVNAQMEILWLTDDGHMDSPSEYADAGWLRSGAKPGNPGTSVIAGHYGWIRWKPMVFANLHRMRKGDTVTVIDRKWQSADFTVLEIRTYLAEDSAEEVFGTVEGSSRLNIVTCQGAWNSKNKSYPNRLVVFAEKKSGT